MPVRIFYEYIENKVIFKHTDNKEQVLRIRIQYLRPANANIFKFTTAIAK